MSDISPLVGANLSLNSFGSQGTVETKDNTKAQSDEATQKIESNDQDKGIGVNIDAKI